MPRGGPRPGAGAPRGNTNALRTGRHSRRYPVAAYYVRVLPRLRRELDLAHRRDPAAAAARLRHLLDAAHHALDTTPDLVHRLEAAIYVRRERLPAIRGGKAALQLIVNPRREPYMQNLLGVCGWLINRDPVFAEALTDILMPPLQQALDMQQQARGPYPQPARKTIKALPAPKTESESPPAFDCSPEPPPSRIHKPRKNASPRNSIKQSKPPKIESETGPTFD